MGCIVCVFVFFGVSCSPMVCSVLCIPKGVMALWGCSAVFLFVVFAVCSPGCYGVAVLCFSMCSVLCFPQGVFCVVYSPGGDGAMRLQWCVSVGSVLCFPQGVLYFL